MVRLGCFKYKMLEKKMTEVKELCAIVHIN